MSNHFKEENFIKIFVFSHYKKRYFILIGEYMGFTDSSKAPLHTLLHDVKWIFSQCQALILKLKTFELVTSVKIGSLKNGLTFDVNKKATS